MREDIYSMACRLFVWCFLLVMPLSGAYSAEAFQFTDDDKTQYIGRYLDVFKDPTKQLSFKDIYAQTTAFQPSRRPVPNLGVEDVNNWLRFSIRNLSTSEKLVVNLSHTNIDEVVFYAVREDGSIDSMRVRAGDDLQNRDYPHQFFLFEIPMQHGEQVTCYIKLHSSTQLLAPISIHAPKSLLMALSSTDIFSALYVGLMLSMILYNIFLYFSTKEPHYYVYVNYIFWVTVAQLAVLGLLEPLFAINSNWVSSRLLTFTGAMSGIGAIFFVKSFLHTAKDSPKFNFLLNGFLIGYLIAIALLISGNKLAAYRIVNIVAGGGSTIVLILAFKLSRHKYQQTKYFLFAWCVFLVSVLVYVLKDYDVLPYNFFTLRAVQFGSAVEAILLSFALADKINIYRKEKEDSQARALLVLQENQQLIREQNIILEQKVDERTRELTESNESLQTALTNLKEAQSQLVEAEKMASLGQLTAGVAHEINNPINFVTSNVAPLKRDIGMMWEAIDEIEKVGLSDLSAEEKKEQIASYKEELDIEYLKTEIDFLLKGMHEGASRTAEIVKSLRIFSRVDEDALKYADVNEGLESTLVILNSVVKDVVKVSKQYGDLPVIECYPGKLNQVFLNIITNAIYAINKKFSGRKGGILTIKTTVESTNAHIIIQDNGIGMSDQVKEKIFEPFFTTKEVGEGTGLGMSIVYNTIKKHRGEIKIDSVEGEGTTFELIIPLKQQMQ